MKRIKTLYQGAYFLLEEPNNKQVGIVLGCQQGKVKELESERRKILGILEGRPVRR